MLAVRCPNCGNTMKCEPKGENLRKKRKSCVYCGKSFGVAASAIKKLK